MKKILSIFFIALGLGIISSFTFAEESQEINCYVYPDSDNIEIIYIPENSNDLVYSDSIFEE